jgi:hypothetical protein
LIGRGTPRRGSGVDHGAAGQRQVCVRGTAVASQRTQLQRRIRAVVIPGSAQPARRVGRPVVAVRRDAAAAAVGPARRTENRSREGRRAAEHVKGKPALLRAIAPGDVRQRQAPPRHTMPPPVAAALPLNVVFVTVADAALSRPPPSPDTAVLSFSIFSDSVRMPATFAMAPPFVPCFRS